jgi:hypothetical protein
MKGRSLNSTPAHTSMAKWRSLKIMGESTGDENANLYMRGVNEGRSGELLEASDLLDILEVFGEDGMRSYLMGVVEGQEDAAEDEQGGED